MAAKLLHSLADDNPDLQKQIGCMTGIFQIFDRHQVLNGGRRLHHKRLLPGPSHFTNGSLELDANNDVYHRQTAAEMSSNKNVHENHRVSTESSRASFSSSCSSSLSSLDCNRTAQPEGSSFDRIIFPETPSRDPTLKQTSTSPHFGRQSLDLRDVVKDSMYREARGLSVKTTSKEESVGRTMKNRDSPRPLQLSTSVDGIYSKGKQNVEADLKESLRILAKLREPGELGRSSYETSPVLSSRDAPRFSYDGRELDRLSFESRDSFKSASKLKELPRLSLDSREGSMRSSSSDSKTNNYHQKNMQWQKGIEKLDEKVPQKRPPSVVAKLMGLEALPDSTSARDSNLDWINARPDEDRDALSRSSEKNNLNRPIQISISPRSSLKDPNPISPRWKAPNPAMKPISSSRLPIEPAPWKRSDGSSGFQKLAFRPVKAPAKAPNSFPSVYSEIEKRLKDLEFNQSGKDLRALKQILEAMQAKGLLETGQQGQASNCVCGPQRLSQRVAGQRNSQSNNVIVATARETESMTTFESPIVIMKPAKLVDHSGVPASSINSIDNLSGVHNINLRNNGFTDSKRDSINSRRTKDQTPKSIHRDSAPSSADKKTVGKNTRSSSMRSQPLVKENNTSSVKSSGSVSPRLQQRKLDLEKRSRPPTPPSTSDSSKPRRQSNKQQTESGSPGRKLRLKSPNLPQSDDQLSENSNESRPLSYPGGDMSMQSDNNMALDSKIAVEETSIRPSAEINGCYSSSMKPSKYAVTGLTQNNSTRRLSEDGPLAELASAASVEHPSPVSVLDTSMYGDDVPSPVKQIPDSLKGDDPRNSNDNNGENEWSQHTDNSLGSGLTSEISRKKLQSIEHLVQKLRRLNSNHDESNTDYIASLCENTNPDHRYISEILLASGLLLRDLGSGLATFQLHPSGHPINPELFFVLEQTKGSTSLLSSKQECNTGKPDQGKFHRKLIFDSVNEILVGKLALVAGTCTEPWFKSNNKLVKKTLSAQKLLKELCSEIEQLQEKKPTERSILEDDEDDTLKTTLWEDVMHRSENWNDFQLEISDVALHVERLIFKDLVNEIVTSTGGASALLRPNKPCRRRQLFAN